MGSSSPPQRQQDEYQNQNDDESERSEDDVVQPTHESGNKRKGHGDASGKSKAKKKGTSSSSRSWVWDHFTRTAKNKDKCTCHYCARVMCCATSNGTSCLKKHLDICKEYQVWKDTNAQSQHILNPVGNGGSGNGNLILAKVSEDVFHEATNEMLVLGELPLAWVESLAWRHFCNRVNLHKPQSRRTTTRDIVEMYVKRKAAMMKVLSSNNQRVSLTTDIWVAPTTGASYMVITAHFIDGNWRLRKLTIGFKHISDHKGKTICNVLLECMVEWGIRRVFAITVDNATANSTALESFVDSFKLIGDDALVLNGDYMHVRCCAHILNLVVKDGLHELDASVAAVRNGVQYVRGSSKRVEAFEQKVESGKMTRGSLSLDCKTRWNSTYLMLTRALKFRTAFDKMEAEDKLYNDFFTEKLDGKKRVGPPGSEDWDELDRLVKFLVIFYNSTLVVSASSSASSYKCYNEIVTIERNLVALTKKPDEKLKKKAEAMREKFDKYWGGLKKLNKMLIIASVFDPRNKMKFAGLCFEKLYGKDTATTKELLKSVNDVLEDLFKEYSNVLAREKLNVSSSQTAGTSSAGGQNSQDPDLFDEMDLDNDSGYERMDSLYKEMVNEIGFADTSSELELYLKEKVEVVKSNPLGIPYDVLGWWRTNSSKYPVLSAIARDILAMQVSSVASESAFSNSNRILDPFRSCLTHYTLEVLMCTEQWMKSEIHMNEKGAVTTHELLSDIEIQDKLQREFESKLNLGDS